MSNLSVNFMFDYGEVQ